MDGSINNSVNQFHPDSLAIKDKYPGLNIVQKNNKTIISGKLDLLDTSDQYYDSYLIEIHPSDNYPFRFPYLFEIGGRIPKNIDWHVFESDGHCCIKSIPEEILICKNGINLIDFIEEQVKPYLFNQTYRYKKGYFLQERSHGIAGELEFFQELFATTDILKILNCLLFISKKNEPNRVDYCFCGSGSKYRKCHKYAFGKLSTFTGKEFDFFIGRIVRSENFISAYPTLAKELLK